MSKLKNIIRKTIRETTEKPGEGTYNDFIEKYEERLKSDLNKLRGIGTKLESDKIDPKNYEKFSIAMEKALSPYDDKLADLFDSLSYSDRDLDFDIRKLADFAIRNLDNSGTETVMVVNALEGYIQAAKKFFSSLNEEPTAGQESKEHRRTFGNIRKDVKKDGKLDMSLKGFGKSIKHDHDIEEAEGMEYQTKKAFKKVNEYGSGKGRNYGQQNGNTDGWNYSFYKRNTGGSDPTVMQFFTLSKDNTKIEVEEFQDVYTITINGKKEPGTLFGDKEIMPYLKNKGIDFNQVQNDIYEKEREEDDQEQDPMGDMGMYENKKNKKMKTIKESQLRKVIRNIIKEEMYTSTPTWGKIKGSEYDIGNLRKKTMNAVNDSFEQADEDNAVEDLAAIMELLGMESNGYIDADYDDIQGTIKMADYMTVNKVYKWMVNNRMINK